MADEIADVWTREMRLVSRILDGRLADFLALRRTPGPTWKSWENIGYDLKELTGESFSREAIRRWAICLGIPVDSRPSDGPHLRARYEQKRARNVSREPAAAQSGSSPREDS